MPVKGQHSRSRANRCWDSGILESNGTIDENGENCSASLTLSGRMVFGEGFGEACAGGCGGEWDCFGTVPFC